MNLGLIIGSFIIGGCIFAAANTLKPKDPDPSGFLRIAEHGRYQLVAEGEGAAWRLDTSTGEVMRCTRYLAVEKGEATTVCFDYLFTGPLRRVE